MPNSPLSGIHYFTTGFSLITKKGIRSFVIIPLLINILLFSALIFYSWLKFQTVKTQIIAMLPDWLQWLEWLLVPLFIFVVLMILFIAFAWIGNIIGGYFNEKLSKAVEYHLTGKIPQTTSSAGVLSTMNEVMGTIFYIVFRVIILLILSIIPVINVISPILWFAFSAWLLNLEYTSYPRDNHGFKPSEQRKLLKNKKILSLSFGSITLMATLIPIVNFFVMPVAVAGATVMWIREFPE